MAWFRLEDNFHQHPKVMKAGNAATGLWVRCGTYSSQYLTDGFIPTQIINSYGHSREVQRLLATHLWVETEGGMLMPDYLEYNPSAARVRQRRKDDAERKRGERGRGFDAVDRGVAGRFEKRAGSDPFR